MILCCQPILGNGDCQRQGVTLRESSRLLGRSVVETNQALLRRYAYQLSQVVSIKLGHQVGSMPLYRLDADPP